MRTTIGWAILILITVFDCKAESLQGVEIGSQKVSGEILEVRSDPLITVKIKTSSGEEMNVDGGKLDSLNLSKVIAWMTREARANGALRPQLRFTPTKQSFSKNSRSAPTPGYLTQSSSRHSSLVHSCAVVNSAAAPTTRVVLRRLARQVVTESSTSTDRRESISWKEDTIELSQLGAYNTRRVSFPELNESYSKQTSTRSVRSGSSMSTASKVTVREVKITAVYLLALDDKGQLIYLMKI